MGVLKTILPRASEAPSIVALLCCPTKAETFVGRLRQGFGARRFSHTPEIHPIKQNRKVSGFRNNLRYRSPFGRALSYRRLPKRRPGIQSRISELSEAIITRRRMHMHMNNRSQTLARGRHHEPVILACSLAYNRLEHVFSSCKSAFIAGRSYGARFLLNECADLGARNPSFRLVVSEGGPIRSASCAMAWIIGIVPLSKSSTASSKDRRRIVSSMNCSQLLLSLRTASRLARSSTNWAASAREPFVKRVALAQKVSHADCLHNALPFALR